MNAQKVCVLIVEDAPELLRIWSLLFKSFTNYVVRVSASVGGARSCIEEGFQPDVIVSDYFLGEGNGLDLIRFAKSRLPRVIPILVTGNDEDESVARSAQSGEFDLMVKPVKFPELHSVIISRLAERDADIPKGGFLPDRESSFEAG